MCQVQGGLGSLGGQGISFILFQVTLNRVQTAEGRFGELMPV